MYIVKANLNMHGDKCFWRKYKKFEKYLNLVHVRRHEHTILIHEDLPPKLVSS